MLHNCILSVSSQKTCWKQGNNTVNWLVMLLIVLNYFNQNRGMRVHAQYNNHKQSKQQYYRCTRVHAQFNNYKPSNHQLYRVSYTMYQSQTINPSKAQCNNYKQSNHQLYRVNLSFQRSSRSPGQWNEIKSTINSIHVYFGVRLSSSSTISFLADRAILWAIHKPFLI